MNKNKISKHFLDFKSHTVGDLVMSPFEVNAGSDIVHHKNAATLNAYKWLFDLYGKPSSLFEIGTKNGGSLVLWDLLFNSESRDTKIAGIDINLSQLLPAANAYINNNGIDVFNCNCLDTDKLRKIMHDTFDGSVDMIIDDGAHNLETILPSFRLLWPMLNNSGIYVIEDWSAIDRLGRLTLYDELFSFLIQNWTDTDTTTEFPFFIHVHRNFIAIIKK
jgi:cephalosporin hydroxylase